MARREQRSVSGERSPDTSRAVPEHLLPGNNAGQMNWAEQQLARAQQSQRPLSDLPGFAANFLKNQQQTEGGVGGEEEYEEHALFNPGLIDQVVCSRAILPSQHSASALACAACACNCTWYNVV
ncbi:MAG: hypothetical protein ACPIOQ_25470 [Promethearchaeia archaeon]